MAIKSFLQFIAEEKKTLKIVMLDATSETQQKMLVWCKENGFDITKNYQGGTVDEFKFHLTVVCSNNEVTTVDAKHEIPPIELDPTKFEALGDEKNIPTLCLGTNEKLDAIRNYFVEVEGMKPTYAEFKPHLSLSYNWAGEPDLKDLKLPTFKITFDVLKVKTFIPKET